VSGICLKFPTLGATSSFLQPQKYHRPSARLCKISCYCNHSVGGLGKNSITNLFLCK
jgi:hypothetical protein